MSYHVAQVLVGPGLSRTPSRSDLGYFKRDKVHAEFGSLLDDDCSSLPSPWMWQGESRMDLKSFNKKNWKSPSAALYLSHN